MTRRRRLSAKDFCPECGEVRCEHRPAPSAPVAPVVRASPPPSPTWRSDRNTPGLTVDEIARKHGALRALYPKADVSDALDFKDWFTVTELSQRLGAPVAEVQRDLGRMLKQDRAIADGKARGTRYRLAP